MINKNEIDIDFYDDLTSKLIEHGPSGYYLLESFVINLLQAEAAANGQEVTTHTAHSRQQHDAVAPLGLGSILGPVAIEISWSSNLEKLKTGLYRLANSTEPTFASFLFIFLNPLDQRDVQHLQKRAPTGSQIVLWGRSELKQLISKYPNVAREAAANLFSNRMRHALQGADDNWQSRRLEIIQEIKRNYQSGRFSLLLGAGVSSSAGLPDWDTLLNSLFVSMLATDEIGKKRSSSEAEADEISSIVKRLRQIDGPSAITLARYIRRGIGADSAAAQGDFIDTVTKQLYGLRNKKYSIDSALIKAIADLCVPNRTGANIRSVLTYNFDDLLERELEVRGLQYRSIFEEVQLATAEELPVYHVHGFLPEDRSRYLNISKSTLVFSEEGYHQIYGDAYHWSNLTQLSSLKETSCLMIGLSLTDPNLRRLLEISAKSIDKPKHFAFMKRIPYSKFSKDGEKAVIRAPASTVRRFLERHHKLNEEVMKELGVNIIWYEEYDEIPRVLHDIGVPGSA